MTYINGNIAATANPALDLYTQVATALAAEGWTLEDTVVISTRTHKVWKSAAAGNLYGDFYIDFVYPTTGAGWLVMIPYEGYNAASDLGIRGPLSGGGTNVFAPETTYYSRYGATGQTLESTLWMPTGSVASGFGFNTSTAGFGYAISVTRNRVVGYSTINPTELPYCGFYEPAPEHAAYAAGYIFPLIVLNVKVASQAGAIGLTRFPKITASQEMRRQYQAGQTSLLVAYPTPSIPSDGRSGQGTYLLNRIPISTDFTYVASLATVQWGWLRDVGMSIVDNTVARGDTVTIGADTWVLGSQSGTSPVGALAFKAI